MNVLDIAAMSAAQSQQGAGIAMLKKAQELAQLPLQLLPSPPAASSPSPAGLGGKVDVVC